MGAAVLAVTGAEALYADMGHFGRIPIRLSWLAVVLPSLVLNYLGQAALLLRRHEALESPFFLLAPHWFQWPLLILASLAAVIASQAVISGVFSVTQQAIQLGFIPRMTIRHTSVAAGQVFIPAINSALLVAVVILVLVFQRSTNLTATYGVAVTGAMLIDNVLLAVVLLRLWRWKPIFAVPLLALFFAVDAVYLAANLTKVPDGGWVPLLMGVVIFILLTTWSRGRALLRANMAASSIPLEVFTKSAHASAARVPGTAVFMASATAGVPSALLHNMKHNKVLHERIVLMTVQIEDTPFARGGARFRQRVLSPEIAFRLSGGNRRARRVERADAVRRTVRHDAHQFFPVAPDAAALGHAGHGPVARKAVFVDAAQRSQRDGILSPADQPRCRTGQPDQDLGKFC
jgi:KUP system potassium uptake protein